MFQPDLTEVTYTFPPASLASVSQVLPLESGTCNLTIGGVTTDGVQTYDTTHSSTWQRFGNVVRITGFISVATVTSSPTGNPLLRGLPFAPATTGAGGRGYVARNFGAITGTTTTLFQFQGSTNFLFGSTGGGVSPTMGSGTIYFTIEYMI
jgi:hypothetical protein